MRGGWGMGFRLRVSLEVWVGFLYVFFCVGFIIFGYVRLRFIR